MAPSTISYRLPGTMAPGVIAFEGTLMRAADVRAQIAARMCCPEYTIEIVNATTSQPIPLTDNIPAYSEVAVRRLSDPQAYAAARGGGGGGAIGARGRGFGAGMQAPPLSAAAIRAGDAAAAEAAKARHYRADATDPAAAAAAGGLSGAALDEAERLAAIAAREAAAALAAGDGTTPAPVSGSTTGYAYAGRGAGGGGGRGAGGYGGAGAASAMGGRGATGGGTGGDPATLNRPPREGYTCYICGRAGHYIEHCPEANSNGGGRGGGAGGASGGGARHPKRFTNPDGIPESELERVERGDPTATFITRDGQWVRRKMLGASALTHLLAVNPTAPPSSSSAVTSGGTGATAAGVSSTSDGEATAAGATTTVVVSSCALCGTKNDLQRLPCECAALLCGGCVDSRIELGDDGPECPKCRGAIQLDEITPVE